MKLSVIIVNYNVCYFLEQTVKSVEKASLFSQKDGYEIECIVVDNDSKDQSLEMMEQKFPHIQVIANKDNTGFSKANNQGINASNAEYVLLLNPDTVIAEDTLSQCIAFMDQHTNCGALGIKMIDGTGTFLPESKRGVPTPAVSLYKMLGLSKIFPKSEKFNQYHLGYLDKNKNHKVPVLSGAFMFMRKSTLDEVGLLDESFFMYGEDIDLSYRIVNAGYDNYYFADSSIIHYKGESTKKGSLNYVRIFYKAMIIFAEKHFAQKQSNLFSSVISVGIYIRAFLDILISIFNKFYAPVLDAFFLFGGMLFLKNFWSNKFIGTESYYSSEFLTVNVPLYILIWIISIFFSGGYDKPFNIWKLVRGLLFGTLITSAVYGFLPEAYRFSRALILLGMTWGIVFLSFYRMILSAFFKQNIVSGETSKGKLAIVGDIEEGNRIRNLLFDTGLHFDFIGFIDPKNQIAENEPNNLGNISEISSLINLYKIDELIFCSKNIPFKTIIQLMEQLKNNINYRINYRIVVEGSKNIVGSDSKNNAGNPYLSEQTYKIITQGQKRNKRVFDITMSLALILLFPILILFSKNKSSYLKNCLTVLIGKKSWIGFGEYNFKNLPKIKNSIYSPIDHLEINNNTNTQKRLLQGYAKDYSIYKDFRILLKGIF